LSEQADLRAIPTRTWQAWQHQQGVGKTTSSELRTYVAEVKKAVERMSLALGLKKNSE